MLTKGEGRIKYYFIMPAVLLVILMMAFPLGYNIYMSFSDWNMSPSVAPKWVGVKNYVDLFQDYNFVRAVRFTGFFTLLAVVLEMFIGTALAIFASKLKKRSASLLKTLIIIPMVMTPVVIGMVWRFLMDPSIGTINVVLKMLGLPTPLWLTSVDTVLPSLVLINVWFAMPMVMLIVLSGISSLPHDCYESAYIDGANQWQVLTKITLPLLMPTLRVTLIIITIDSLKAFDIIYTATQGGPSNASINLNYLIFKNLFEFLRIGKGSAATVFFIVIVAILTSVLLAIRIKNREVQ